MPELQICIVRHGHRPLRHRLERPRHCRRAASGSERRRDACTRTAALSGARGGRHRRAMCRHAIDGIVALLSGEPRDLTDVAIDDDGDSRNSTARVYAIARTIPPGADDDLRPDRRTARRQMLAREVGQALGQNPTPIVMPCHRVLAANGKPGGFSAIGGVVTKLRLLSIEKRAAGRPDVVRASAVGCAPARLEAARARRDSC